MHGLCNSVSLRIYSCNKVSLWVFVYYRLTFPQPGIVHNKTSVIKYLKHKDAAIGGLKDITKFTGKHLWQSLFFNKVAGWDSSTRVCL